MPDGGTSLFVPARSRNASAGTNHDAETPLTSELVESSDVIFVMEKAHRNKLQQRFRPVLKSKRVICVDIPDDYAFMEPALVRLLKQELSRSCRSKLGRSRSSRRGALRQIDTERERGAVVRRFYPEEVDRPEG